MRKGAKIFIRVVSAALGIVFAVFAVYQYLRFTHPDYVSEICTVNKISDSVTVRGLVIRDETVIDFGENRNIDYIARDGEKVAVDEPVARVSTGGNGSVMKGLRRTEIESEASLLESLSENSSSGYSNISHLNGSIYESAVSIAGSTSFSDFESASEEKLSLIKLFNSYYLALDGICDFSQRQAKLKTALNGIGDDEFYESYLSPIEGYFISYTDGCEQIMNTENIADYGISQIKSIINSDYEKDYYSCKIVTGYSWDLVVVVSSNLDRFSEGRSVKLNFPYRNLNGVPAKIKSVIPDAGGKQAVVVVTCNRMNADIAALRDEVTEISFGTYEGIKVPRSALRFYNGEVGVFINYGSVVQFKSVDVMYETDDYIVSRNAPVGSGKLCMYDELILQGRDLYPGRDL